MGNTIYEKFHFNEDTLIEMDEFEKEFLSNKIKKDVSKNSGLSSKDDVLLEDMNAFDEYLDSDWAEPFLSMA